MSLEHFLVALAETGRVRVADDARISSADRAQATVVLETLDQQARAHFPGTAPVLDTTAALWGAERLYHACQALVYREWPAPLVQALLAEEFRGPREASSIYSVDLTLAALPELFRLARGLSSNDPLVGLLVELGCDWPLSSVGMPGVQCRQLEPVLTHAGLRQLYLDRVLATGDRSRCDQPEVRQWLHVNCGLFPELTPPWAVTLFASSSPAAASVSVENQA